MQCYSSRRFPLSLHLRWFAGLRSMQQPWMSPSVQLHAYCLGPLGLVSAATRLPGTQQQCAALWQSRVGRLTLHPDVSAGF
jgi:hypothetical protein